MGNFVSSHKTHATNVKELFEQNNTPGNNTPELIPKKKTQGNNTPELIPKKKTQGNTSPINIDRLSRLEVDTQDLLSLPNDIKEEDIPVTIRSLFVEGEGVLNDVSVIEAFMKNYAKEDKKIDLDNIDKKKAQLYILKKENSIDLEDIPIITKTSIDFLNSKLEIFLSIIWEYLIYDETNILKTVQTLKESIFEKNEFEGLTLQEFISSKNIHQCFNIMNEIDKINKLKTMGDIEDSYKNKDIIKKDGLTIPVSKGTEVFFYFSSEKTKISLGVSGLKKKFNYVFFLSQEYTEELERIIYNYYESKRQGGGGLSCFTIDDDNFNTFQFIYTEETKENYINGIIPTLNLTFENVLKEEEKSTLIVKDIDKKFQFEGKILGVFDDIYFFSILCKLDGTITWENEKKCTIVGNGQTLTLEGYFQFDDYNFYGKIIDNEIASEPYFDKDANEIYNIIEKKNNDTLFRLNEKFEIDTTNRNLELGIPISFLLIYKPENNDKNIKQQSKNEEKKSKKETSKVKFKKKKPEENLNYRKYSNTSNIKINKKEVPTRDIEEMEREYIEVENIPIINVNLPLLIKNLVSFIELCNYQKENEETNRIVNNRRRLIFPILDELSQKQFFQTLIKLLWNKENIYICDFENIKRKSQRQRTFFMGNHSISSSSTSSDTGNDLIINIHQEPKKQGSTDLLSIEYGLNTVNIKVSCLSNFNNNENLNSIIMNLENIQQYKNCYKSQTTKKNPLDDFLILIIVQFLFEFRTLLFFSNIKKFYKYKVKIISDDRFKDWNVEYQVSSYKENKKKFVPIFTFLIINPVFKKYVEDSIDNLYLQTQNWIENDTNILIKNFMALKHER